MKDEHRSYTIIIAPDDHGEVRQFHVTRRHLLYTALLTTLLPVIGLAGILYYLNAAGRLENYHSILTSHGQLQSANLEYQARTRQLAEKISYIEMMARTAVNMSGIDFDNPQSPTGGMGGFSPDNWLRHATLKPANPDLLQQLNRQAGELGHQIARIKDSVFEQNLFLSSLPAGWPARGYQTSGFGYRRHPISGQREFHPGIDISAPTGAKVITQADGVVLSASAQTGYGYIVTIAHNYGISTRYAHLSGFAVRTGQRVKKGEVIGFIGSTGNSTGPHLHYEVRVNDRPVNPARFMGSPTAM